MKPLHLLIGFVIAGALVAVMPTAAEADEVTLTCATPVTADEYGFFMTDCTANYVAGETYWLAIAIYAPPSLSINVSIYDSHGNLIPWNGDGYVRTGDSIPPGGHWDFQVGGLLDTTRMRGLFRVEAWFSSTDHVDSDVLVIPAIWPPVGGIAELPPLASAPGAGTSGMGGATYAVLAGAAAGALAFAVLATVSVKRRRVR